MLKRWMTSPSFVSREIAGELVIVPLSGVTDPRLDNAMISLNETAAFLWKLFESGPHSAQEAVAAVLASFDGPEDMISDHVNQFIISHVACGMLVEEEL